MEARGRALVVHRSDLDEWGASGAGCRSGSRRRGGRTGAAWRGCGRTTRSSSRTAAGRARRPERGLRPSSATGFPPSPAREPRPRTPGSRPRRTGEARSTSARASASGPNSTSTSGPAATAATSSSSGSTPAGSPRPGPGGASKPDWGRAPSTLTGSRPSLHRRKPSTVHQIGVSPTPPSSSVPTRGASWAGGCRARLAPSWPLMRLNRPCTPATSHEERSSIIPTAGQYQSLRYAERLAQAGVEPSVGRVGDSCDNALAESIIGGPRPSSSSGAVPGGASKRSSSPPSNGSTGTTIGGSWGRSGTFPRRRRRRTTSDGAVQDGPDFAARHHPKEGTAKPRHGRGRAGRRQEKHEEEAQVTTGEGTKGATRGCIRGRCRRPCK